MARKRTELRPVMVRLPETLRRRVERDAERNGRSMNTEIIHRLEQSFAEVDLRDTVESLRVGQAETGKALQEMQRNLTTALFDMSQGLFKEPGAVGGVRAMKRDPDSHEHKAEGSDEGSDEGK
jgi:Arc-like DNA binding domain